jgi:hypothetical protein
VIRFLVPAFLIKPTFQHGHRKFKFSHPQSTTFCRCGGTFSTSTLFILEIPVGRNLREKYRFGDTSLTRKRAFIAGSRTRIESSGPGFGAQRTVEPHRKRASEIFQNEDFVCHQGYVLRATRVPFRGENAFHPLDLLVPS